MAKNRHTLAKRQRELEKKRKAEEKRQRRRAKAKSGTDGPSSCASEPPAA